MNVYVTVAVTQVEPDATVSKVVEAVRQAVQAQFTAHEIEVVEFEVD